MSYPRPVDQMNGMGQVYTRDLEGRTMSFSPEGWNLITPLIAAAPRAMEANTSPTSEFLTPQPALWAR